MLTSSIAISLSSLLLLLSHRHYVVQMEEVIARMQDEKNGIPIRTVKSFLTKIPSVFSGKFAFILSSAVLLFLARTHKVPHQNCYCQRKQRKYLENCPFCISHQLHQNIKRIILAFQAVQSNGEECILE